MKSGLHFNTEKLNLKQHVKIFNSFREKGVKRVLWTHRTPMLKILKLKKFSQNLMVQLDHHFKMKYKSACRYLK